MGEHSVRVAAPPEAVFAEVTRKFEDAEAGSMKVGDQFHMPDPGANFTVTLLEPPTRFGISWVYKDFTYVAEYTVLPDAGGSLVQLEIDQRSVRRPVSAFLFGGLLEGRQEKQLLADLKQAVEKGSEA